MDDEAELVAELERIQSAPNDQIRIEAWQARVLDKVRTCCEQEMFYAKHTAGIIGGTAPPAIQDWAETFGPTWTAQVVATARYLLSKGWEPP